jgi:hypothetical protein
MPAALDGAILSLQARHKKQHLLFFAESLILGAVFIKSTLTIVQTKKKFQVVFPKTGVDRSTGTEEKKENSPRWVQTFPPPRQFSLNAIVIKINPLDINRMTFLHVARNSSVTVARGQH